MKHLKNTKNGQLIFVVEAKGELKKVEQDFERMKHEMEMLQKKLDRLALEAVGKQIQFDPNVTAITTGTLPVGHTITSDRVIQEFEENCSFYILSDSENVCFGIVLIIS